MITIKIMSIALFGPERGGYTSPGQHPGTRTQKDLAL